MFKLTRHEQAVVAFLLGAVLLGTIVRQWRMRTAPQGAAAAATVEKRDP